MQKVRENIIGTKLLKVDQWISGSRGGSRGGVMVRMAMEAKSDDPPLCHAHNYNYTKGGIKPKNENNSIDPSLCSKQ